MTWTVHEGGKPAYGSNGAGYASTLLNDYEPMCDECLLRASEFMHCSAEAVEQAGIRPDDVIWLGLFGALQKMLAHRAECLACQEKKPNQRLQALPGQTFYRSSSGFSPRSK